MEKHIDLKKQKHFIVMGKNIIKNVKFSKQIIRKPQPFLGCSPRVMAIFNIGGCFILRRVRHHDSTRRITKPLI